MGNIKPYKWVPGTGPSVDAIERMREHFKKPSVLMGEAWFISLNRRMYPELNDTSVFQNLAPIEVSQILFEISAGTSCFGHMEEWDDWFRYLLPDLIKRSNDYLYWEQLLLQSVVTSFFEIFWKGIDDEYDGFKEDIMSSLSHCLMDPKLWDNSEAEIRPIFLDRFRDGKGKLKLMWNAGEADGNFSAAMFFCLKYLYEDEIPNWVKSLTEISHILWQGNLIVWTLGAFDLLNDKPILPAAVEVARPQISWEHSHVLGSKASNEEIDSLAYLKFNDNRTFLSTRNAQLFLAEVRKYFTEEKIVELADRFSADEDLSTFGIPERLYEKLFRHS